MVGASFPRRFAFIYLLVFLDFVVIEGKTGGVVENSCPSGEGSCELLTHEGNGEAETEAEAEAEDCMDVHENCHFWALHNECDKNPSYMKRYCRLSCGTCEERVVVSEGGSRSSNSEEKVMQMEACEDFHEACKAWADDGECLLNPSFMFSACRKSCTLCVVASVDNNENSYEADSLIRRRKQIYSRMELGPFQDTEPPGCTETQSEAAKDIVRSMETYAKEVAVELEEEIRNKCRNHRVECAFEVANEDRCTKDPIAMMRECPLACRTCDRIETFMRCFSSDVDDSTTITQPNKNKMNKTVNPNVVFTEITRDGRWDHLNPVVYHPHTDKKGKRTQTYVPWLLGFDSFATKEELDFIVKSLFTEGGGGTGGDKVKTMWERVDDVEEVPSDDRGYPGIKTTTFLDMKERRGFQRRTLTLWGEEEDKDDPLLWLRPILDRIANVVGVPSSFEHLEDVEILTFLQHGDSYGVHHDFRIDDVWKPAGERILSFSLCLVAPTTTEDGGLGGGGGGAWGFPKLDWLSVPPQAGRALLWPNVVSETSLPESRTVHETLPLIITENKKQKQNQNLTIANVWIHAGNWKAANERGCA